MRKKLALTVLACLAASLLVACSGKESKDATEETKEKTTVEANLYNYGAHMKEYITTEELEEGNVVSKKKIEAMADWLIQTGDERSKEEIVEELGTDEKREKANYLKAVQEGIVVTDDEIEQGIEETKEEIKGTAAETEIEEYCKGAEITMEEYWELQRIIYRRNYMINKYMEKCQEEISGSSEGYNGDFSKEFEKIGDENIKEFGVVMK